MLHLKKRVLLFASPAYGSHLQGLGVLAVLVALVEGSPHDFGRHENALERAWETAADLLEGLPLLGERTRDLLDLAPHQAHGRLGSR